MYNIMKWILFSCGSFLLFCVAIAFVVKIFSNKSQQFQTLELKNVNQQQIKQQQIKQQIIKQIVKPKTELRKEYNVQFNQPFYVDVDKIIVFDSFICINPTTFYPANLVGNRFAEVRFNTTMLKYTLYNKNKGKIWNFDGFSKVCDIVDEYGNTLYYIGNKLASRNLVYVYDFEAHYPRGNPTRVNPLSAQEGFLAFEEVPTTSKHYKIKVSIDNTNYDINFLYYK